MKQQEEEEQLEEQLVPSAGEPSEHLPSFIIMEVGHLIFFFFFFTHVSLLPVFSRLESCDVLVANSVSTCHRTLERRHGSESESFGAKVSAEFMAQRFKNQACDWRMVGGIKNKISLTVLIKNPFIIMGRSTRFIKRLVAAASVFYHLHHCYVT